MLQIKALLPSSCANIALFLYMNKRIRITLNDAEQHLAMHMLKSRDGHGRSQGLDFNHTGVELAFCKAFNIYPGTHADHGLFRADIAPGRDGTPNISAEIHCDGSGFPAATISLLSRGGFVLDRARITSRLPEFYIDYNPEGELIRHRIYFYSPWRNGKRHTSVALNHMEYDLSIYLASRRYAGNRSHGIIDQKIGKQSVADTDIGGIGGEIAFCKLFNFYPDLSLSPRRGGCDCVTKSGRTVDVKHTPYNTGKLLAYRKEECAVDYYALMVGEFPEFDCRGYIPADALIRKENLRDMGYGYLSYTLSQEQLCQIA